MAYYSLFNPNGLITKAMFNFDEFGSTNYKYTGTVNISVSDGFSSKFWPLGSYAEVDWSAAQKYNIKNVFDTFSQFTNIQFSQLVDYDFTNNSTIADPLNVGNLSNINITFGYPGSFYTYGVSGGGSDWIGYVGSEGDIFLNILSDFMTSSDLEFSEYSKLRQVLMHEIQHSLGLSHPFLTQNLISQDFSNLINAGFKILASQ